MGVEVPSWVAEMFQVLTGDGWPAVDEDEVEDLARLWLGVREALAGLAPEVTRSARLLADSGGVEGRAREALVAAVGLVTGEGDLTLEKLAAGFGELGDYLHRVALQTQYLKIIVIEELVILAAEIAYLVAMVPWTFGASAAGVAGLQVLGRAFAMAVVRQLAVAVAVGEVLQVGLDAVAQLVQFAEGWRGEWDGDLTRSAAITGLVGGVLGPVVMGLGHYPGKFLGRALGGVAGGNAGREAGDWAATVVKGGGHEYTTDGASGAVQGQRWRPDTFSTTAGAVDEGITAAAGLGGRKGGHRFYANTLGLDRIGKINVPGKLSSFPSNPSKNVATPEQGGSATPAIPATPAILSAVGTSGATVPGADPVGFTIDELLRGQDVPASTAFPAGQPTATPAAQGQAPQSPGPGERQDGLADGPVRDVAGRRGENPAVGAGAVSRIDLTSWAFTGAARHLTTTVRASGVEHTPVVAPSTGRLLPTGPLAAGPGPDGNVPIRSAGPGTVSVDPVRAPVWAAMNPGARTVVLARADTPAPQAQSQIFVQPTFRAVEHPAREGAPAPEEEAPAEGLMVRAGRLLVPITRLTGWLVTAAGQAGAGFTRITGRWTGWVADLANVGRAGTGPAGTGTTSTDARLTWTPPPAWTERLAQRALRGREFDLNPVVAGVIGAIRGVQEIRLLEPHQLRVTQPVSEFLIGRLSGPIAADVLRRVLETQAREDLAVSVDALGWESAVDELEAAQFPVATRLETGMQRSLRAVVNWASFLGSNPAARASMTEADLVEPAQFVRILRETFGFSLRRARQELSVTPSPSAHQDGVRLAEDLRFVTAAEFDVAWVELGERVTLLRQGNPGQDRNGAREAVETYADQVLRGQAPVPQPREASARDASVSQPPGRDVRFAMAATGIMETGTSSTAPARPGPSSGSPPETPGAAGPAMFPEAVRWQLDLRTSRLLQGLSGDGPELSLVTQVAQVVAARQVLADLVRGDLDAFFGVPLSLRERGELAGAEQAMSVELYERMIADGRDRPPTVGLIATIVAVPAQARAALFEALQALRGFVPAVVWVAEAGLQRENVAVLLDGLWTVLVDNAVPRVLTGAPAETVEAAREELRRFGGTARFVTEVEDVDVALPLWRVLALGFIEPDLRRGFILSTEIVACKGARLLWRWVADPSAPVPPQTARDVAFLEAELRPAAWHRVIERASETVWRGHARWREWTGSPGSHPVPAVSLARVVPRARLATAIPSSFAPLVRDQVGDLLELLPGDTAGVFEAQLATARVLSAYVTGSRGLSASEQAAVTALQESLFAALFDSLAVFGRAATEPAPGGPGEPAPGAAGGPVAAPAEVDLSWQPRWTLPSRVWEALEGLAPAVARVASGEWPVAVATEILTVMRDAFAAQATVAVLPDAPAAVVDSARRQIVRLWDEVGSGLVVEDVRDSLPSWWHVVEYVRAPAWARAHISRRRGRVVQLNEVLQGTRREIEYLSRDQERAMADLERVFRTPQDVAAVAQARHLVRALDAQLGRVERQMQGHLQELTQLRQDEREDLHRQDEAGRQAVAATRAVEHLEVVLASALVAWESGAYPTWDGAGTPGGAVVDGQETSGAVAPVLRRLGVTPEVGRHLAARAEAILGGPVPPGPAGPAAPAARVLLGLATVAAAAELLRESSRLWEAGLQAAGLQEELAQPVWLPVPEPFGVRLPAAEQGALRLRVAELRAELAGQLSGPNPVPPSWQQVELVAMTGLSQVMRAWAPPPGTGSDQRLPSAAVPEQLVFAVRDLVAETVRRHLTGQGAAAPAVAALIRDTGPLGDPVWASVAADVAALRAMPPVERRALHDSVVVRVRRQLESLWQALNPPGGTVRRVESQPRPAVTVTVAAPQLHVVRTGSVGDAQDVEGAGDSRQLRDAVAGPPASLARLAGGGRWMARAVGRAGGTLLRVVDRTGRRLSRLLRPARSVPAGDRAGAVAATGPEEIPDRRPDQIVEALRSLAVPGPQAGNAETSYGSLRAVTDPSPRLGRACDCVTALGDILAGLLDVPGAAVRAGGLAGQGPAAGLERVAGLLATVGSALLPAVADEAGTAGDAGLRAVRVLNRGVGMALTGLLSWAERGSDGAGTPTEDSADSVAQGEGPGPTGAGAEDPAALVQALRTVYGQQLESILEQADGDAALAARACLDAVSGPVVDTGWQHLGEQLARLRRGEIRGQDLRQEVASFLSSLSRRRATAFTRRREIVAGKAAAVDPGPGTSSTDDEVSSPEAEWTAARSRGVLTISERAVRPDLVLTPLGERISSLWGPRALPADAVEALPPGTAARNVAVLRAIFTGTNGWVTPGQDLLHLLTQWGRAALCGAGRLSRGRGRETAGEADSVAVACLDAGVQLALHDLAAGAESPREAGADGGAGDVPVIGAGVLVRFLRAVYADALAGLYAGAVDPAAVAAARQSLDALEEAAPAWAAIAAELDERHHRALLEPCQETGTDGAVLAEPGTLGDARDRVVEVAERERMDPESVDPESVDPESVELESVELESVELESVALEPVELEPVALEPVALELVDLEDAEVVDVMPDVAWIDGMPDAIWIDGIWVERTSPTPEQVLLAEAVIEAVQRVLATSRPSWRVGVQDRFRVMAAMSAGLGIDLAMQLARLAAYGEAHEALLKALEELGRTRVAPGNSNVAGDMVVHLVAALEDALGAVLAWAYEQAVEDLQAREEAERQGMAPPPQPDLTEPGAFVQTLRAVVLDSARSMLAQLPPAAADETATQQELRIQREEALTWVFGPDADATWRELANRLGQVRLGNPSPVYGLGLMARFIQATLYGGRFQLDAGAPAAPGLAVEGREAPPVVGLLPPDRIGSAWGPEGLTAGARTALLQDPHWPGIADQMVTDLHAHWWGALSDDQLVALLQARGRQFLAGPGGEVWARGLVLPGSAGLRFLDAGMEVALHDLAGWMARGAPFTAEQREQAGWAGQDPTGVGGLGLWSLVARLQTVYRRQLAARHAAATDRASAVQVLRSLGQVSGPGVDEVWRAVIQRLTWLGGRPEGLEQVVEENSRALAMLRPSQMTLPTGWRPVRPRSGAARARQAWASGLAVARAAAPGKATDTRPDPDGRTSDPDGRTSAESVERAFVGVVDALVGEDGLSARSLAALTVDSPEQARTVSVLLELLGGTVTVPEVLAHLAERAEQLVLRSGVAQDAIPLGELLRAVGVVFGAPVTEAIPQAQPVGPVGPVGQVDAVDWATGSGLAAVRLLDVGVEAALHDLVLRAERGSWAGGSGTTFGGHPGDIAVVDAVTGPIDSPALVYLLRQVYRSRLHELRGDVDSRETAEAVDRSWRVVEGPAADAAWDGFADRLVALGSGLSSFGAETLSRAITAQLAGLRAEPVVAAAREREPHASQGLRTASSPGQAPEDRSEGDLSDEDRSDDSSVSWPGDLPETSPIRYRAEEPRLVPEPGLTTVRLLPAGSEVAGAEAAGPELVRCVPASSPAHPSRLALGRWMAQQVAWARAAFHYPPRALRSAGRAIGLLAARQPTMRAHVLAGLRGVQVLEAPVGQRLPVALLRPVDVQLAGHLLRAGNLPLDVVYDVLHPALVEANQQNLIRVLEELGHREMAAARPGTRADPAVLLRVGVNLAISGLVQWAVHEARLDARAPVSRDPVARAAAADDARALVRTLREAVRAQSRERAPAPPALHLSVHGLSLYELREYVVGDTHRRWLAELAAGRWQEQTELVASARLGEGSPFVREQVRSCLLRDARRHLDSVVPPDRVGTAWGQEGPGEDAVARAVRVLLTDEVQVRRTVELLRELPDPGRPGTVDPDLDEPAGPELAVLNRLIARGRLLVGLIETPGTSRAEAFMHYALLFYLDVGVELALQEIAAWARSERTGRNAVVARAPRESYGGVDPQRLVRALRSAYERELRRQLDLASLPESPDLAGDGRAVPPGRAALLRAQAQIGVEDAVVPPDRVGTAWGQEGLGEDVVARAVRVLLTDEVQVRRTVELLRELPDPGRPGTVDPGLDEPAGPELAVLDRLTERGRRLVRLSDGSWTSRAEAFVPYAPVFYLDSGVELALYEIAAWARSERTRRHAVVARAPRESYGAVDPPGLVLALRSAYERQLRVLVRRLSEGGRLSAARSLVATSGDEGRSTWELIGHRIGGILHGERLSDITEVVRETSRSLARSRAEVTFQQVDAALEDLLPEPLSPEPLSPEPLSPEPLSPEPEPAARTAPVREVVTWRGVPLGWLVTRIGVDVVLPEEFAGGIAARVRATLRDVRRRGDDAFLSRVASLDAIVRVLNAPASGGRAEVLRAELLAAVETLRDAVYTDLQRLAEVRRQTGAGDAGAPATDRTVRDLPAEVGLAMEGLAPAVNELARLPRGTAQQLLDGVRDALVLGSVVRMRPEVTAGQLAEILDSVALRWTGARVMAEHFGDDVPRPLWRRAVAALRPRGRWQAAARGGPLPNASARGAGATRAGVVAPARTLALVDHFAGTLEAVLAQLRDGSAAAPGGDPSPGVGRITALPEGWEAPGTSEASGVPLVDRVVGGDR